MKREHISFGDWLDSASGDWHDSASPHEQERLIKTAYQLLPRTLNRRSEKKAEAAQKAFVEILNHIHDTYFEYHELQFFFFHKVVSYKQFQSECFVNSYRSDMLSTISSMIQLCPDEKKAFFQNLYVSYERDLAQYRHDMEVLVQIKDYFAAEKWRECGLLLEQEIRNNPSTVAWYVYMALIKTRIDPSYDCEQEFYALNKYFNQKNYKIDKKKFDGKYYRSYNFSIREKNSLRTHYIHYFYVSSTLDSLSSYSRRFTSLLFLPYNIVVGALCGIKIPIVGIVLVPICAVGVFIRHIIQLAYITKPRFFRKIIQKVIQSNTMSSHGDCFYSFAQISYCEKINEAFLDFWDLLEIPIGLISLG